MFSYMKKAESFQNKDWFKANHSEHGTDGPLTTAPHDPAPISSRVLESFQSKGLPLNPDMFTTGKIAQGCGHPVRKNHKGVRTTSFDYIGGDQKYPNIDVLTSHYVDTILLEQRGTEFDAVGVQAQDASGRELRIGANKEVVVTSGAYGSPPVLLRSGIGPKTELEELGITPKVDLPGVGKNLMDHLVSRDSLCADTYSDLCVSRLYSTSTKFPSQVLRTTI
jgi:choline dehydrogenase-like flavoprotein